MYWCYKKISLKNKIIFKCTPTLSLSDLIISEHPCIYIIEIQWCQSNDICQSILRIDFVQIISKLNYRFDEIQIQYNITITTVSIKTHQLVTMNKRKHTIIFRKFSRHFWWNKNLKFGELWEEKLTHLNNFCWMSTDWHCLLHYGE